LRGQDGVDEVAIDLGEVSWDYETAVVSARPAWYGPAAKALAVAAVAVGLVWGSVPASPPALGEPLWSSPTSMPGLGVTPNAIFAVEADSIIAHEPRTGRELWRAQVPERISYLDWSYSGVLVAMSYSVDDGYQSGLTLIEEGTGKILADFWETDMDGSAIGRSGELLLLYYRSVGPDFDESCRGDGCAVLTAVDIRDGRTAWSYRSRQPGDLLTSIVDGQVISLAFVGREGRVNVVDPADGSVRSVFEIGAVQHRMSILAGDNLITLELASGQGLRQGVVKAYGIRSQALEWEATIELDESAYLESCDKTVCIGDSTRSIVLDDKTGRVVEERPHEFQEGTGFGLELTSGVRIGFVEPSGFSTDRSMEAVVTDPAGRVIRRIERVVPVWSEERTESAHLLRRGKEAVDLLSVDGSGKVGWLGQVPSTVEWCGVQGELLTCWSYNEPTTGRGPMGRVWVWHLPQ